MQPLDPSLIRIKNRVLFLRGRTLSLENCKAIESYLTYTKQKQSKVAEIVIDSCEISDEGIACIIQGAVNQSKIQRRGGKPKKQYLNSLTIANSTFFGSNCIEKILKLSDDLHELKLSNIKSMAGFGQKLLSDFFSDYYNNCPFLFKLSLSRIVLNREGLVEQLIGFIDTKKYLQLLDLSWTGLQPYQLWLITQYIVDSKLHSVRDLDLSYNTMHVNESSSDYTGKFFVSLMKLLRSSPLLSHLHLNGMSFSHKQLQTLCETLSSPDCCPLSAVHLSDNGLALRNLHGSNNLFKQALSWLGIDPEEEALPWYRYEEKDGWFNSPPESREGGVQSKQTSFVDNIEHDSTGMIDSQFEDPIMEKDEGSQKQS